MLFSAAAVVLIIDQIANWLQKFAFLIGGHELIPVFFLFMSLASCVIG
jgi:hypothetical protein